MIKIRYLKSIYFYVSLGKGDMKYILDYTYTANLLVKMLFVDILTMRVSDLEEVVK